MFDHCNKCEHVESDCDKCYPELGYKNTKAERDTNAVEEFAKSEVFQRLLDHING